ncbi:putative zinc finger protein [Ixodes scapularis]
MATCFVRRRYNGLRSATSGRLLAGDVNFFSCGLCSYSTTFQKYFQQHLMKHADHRPHTCTVCGDNFKMKCHLVLHMQRHTTKSTESVASKKPLARKKLKAAKRMLCKRSASLPQLPEEFAPKPRQQLECRECSFKTCVYRTLMVHQETHKCDRRLKCRFCDYITVHRSSLLSHEARHALQMSPSIAAGAVATLKAKKKKKQVYKCHTCGYATKYMGRLTTHQKSHIVAAEPSLNGTAEPSAEEDQLPHKCDVCGDSFKMKSSLTNHTNAHKGTRKFKCTSCPKLFKTKTGMQTHTKEHAKALAPAQREDGASGTRGPMSPGAVYNGDDSKVRRSAQVVERIYCCLVCPAELSSRQSLENHMVSDHDQLRPASRSSSLYA